MQVKNPKHDAAATRYRIYRLLNSELTFLGATDEVGVVRTIQQFREDGEFDDGGAVGVLDRPDPDATGTWLINPYSKGRP